jgi:uncharacterized protein
MHHRLSPKVHRFHYKIFMFCIDLDEIIQLDKKLSFFSYKRFNLFNFRDSDHLQYPGREKEEIRAKLDFFLKENGVYIGKGRVILLTHLRTLGYIFNPVSFYYCYNESNDLECAVVEVCNTFREMKLFFISKENLKDNTFTQETQKYFYVSPFIDMDTTFHFILKEPTEKLNIRIDDFKDSARFFISTLTGKRVPLIDNNLFLYMLRFPLIPLQIISLIHWQAFKLWIKRLPFHSKKAFPLLQREILNPNKS